MLFSLVSAVDFLEPLDILAEELLYLPSVGVKLFKLGESLLKFLRLESRKFRIGDRL